MLADMKALRTPDDRFEGLSDYDFEPHYLELGDGLRMHYLDEGPRDARPIVMLHGEPSWSYLYRFMVPPCAERYRVLAPDLVGFGRSDKPSRIDDYSYQSHIDWLREWFEALELREVTLVCQDWGSLLGLRLAAENEAWFSRITVGNGFLSTGERKMPGVFQWWKRFARWSPWFPIARIVDAGTRRKLSAAERAAYDAPFPSSAYKAGTRAFPRLVPASPDDPAAPACRAAWERLGRWEKPFLTFFGAGDPILGRADRPLQEHIPGCQGQPHQRVRAGHFLQEDVGAEWAQAILDWLRLNEVAGLELEQQPGPVEAGAERDEEHQVAGGDPPLVARLGEGERHRSGTGVAEARDVREELPGSEFQAPGHRVEDALIGLVGHDQRDLLESPIRLPQEVDGDVAHPLHRLLEDLATVHDQPAVKAGGRDLDGERQPRTARFETEDVGPAAVGPRRRCEHADRVVTRADDGGPCRVAEQHAGVAVLPVHQTGDELDGHDENVASPLRGAAAGDVEGEHEPGAAAAGEVERRDLTGAEAMLEERRRVRRVGLRRVGGDDDLVDLADADPGIVERRTGRRLGEVDGRLVLGGEAALADPRAGADPLVGGVDPGLPVGIGHHPLGHIGAQAEEADRSFRRAHHGETRV